jgi:predicted ribosome quality control (RQC) complex YloA/Tae2 family protein
MAVHQPAWERVLHLDIEGPEGAVTIIVEPMERRSNVLLVQDGTILDCIRRVGPQDNRVRLSLPAHQYVPPPPQIGKLAPDLVGEAEMLGMLGQNTDAKLQVQRLLSQRLLGMSPLLAREIVFRASGQVDQKAVKADALAVADALHEVLDPLLARDWQPGLAENENGVEAYSVYPLESLAGWHRVDSVSEALVNYYAAIMDDDAYVAAKGPVRAALEEAQAKLSAKLASLERSMTDESERDFLRQSGDLILAYQYALRPGQTELRAQYDPDGPELLVAIDPTLSPVENAQRYFSRYEKAKRALDDVPELIDQTRTEIDYLTLLAHDVDVAASWPDIDEVQQVLQQKGYWQGKRAGRIGGGRKGPERIEFEGGYVGWLGQNSRQNEIVTFEKGSPADLWLHARDVPGAHVIIKFDGRPIPEAVIEQAAALAAFYSPRRDDSRVLVDVTERKYVRKIKGAGAGMVTYRNETTRTVEPKAKDQIS